MIAYISGKLVEKKASEVVIDVNGIGYLCFISTNSYHNLPDNGHNIKLSTYLHVTENSQSLFGFYDNDELEAFKLLINVSGIGPKSAISLLSSINAQDLKDRIINGDVEMLTTISGIGPKTAQRMIIELKDKFIKTDLTDELISNPDNNDKNVKDGVLALTSLGISKWVAKKTIYDIYKKDKNISLENLIKESIAKLNN
mgnify:CR=1 FL=1|tara:strand:+ start:252 stop:848 length:597 start_codon:yes stop_codon:yes gene_type:complete